MDTSFTYLTLNDPTSSITRRRAYRDMFPSRTKANIFYTATAIESRSDAPLNSVGKGNLYPYYAI